VSGSHATDEAAWVDRDGRQVSLSDLDLYVILRDEADCSRARQSDRLGSATRLPHPPELLGPLEVAYLTPTGLAQLPARPGTITLRERGRVILGDAAILQRIPRFGAEQIDREERLALFENRGAELLGAVPSDAVLASDRAWRARHATLKVALDLAGSLLLERGEWPLDARERVRRASLALARHPRRDDPMSVASADLLRLWQVALAWRSGQAQSPDSRTARADWHATVRAWCSLWWQVAGQTASPDAAPWPSIRSVARRTPWLRRVRRSLNFLPRVGEAPSMADRLRHMARGTPQHRLMASVTTLLFSESMTGGAPDLATGAIQNLDALGLIREREMAPAADRAWYLWSRWVAGLDVDLT